MWTLVTANVVNLAGNWALVFGHLGARAMGAEGSGWSTCIARVYMAAVLGFVIWRREPELRKTDWSFDGKRVKALLKLGLPAAGQMALEIGVFAAVAMLIGRLSAVALAANQIAIVIVSTTYMVPLGISSAAAVRVGNRLGAGERSGAVRSGWTAIVMGAAVMSLAGVTLLSVPHGIARLFTPDEGVIAAGVTLLRISAFFQLFDGLQVVASGALRGTGDTHTPMLCHFGGYWLIGLPLGAVLCFREGYGAAGLWAGLSAGLILIGIVLVVLWRRAAKRLGMVN
jgi:MATE family multidrug resistance protein